MGSDYNSRFFAVCQHLNNHYFLFYFVIFRYHLASDSPLILTADMDPAWNSEPPKGTLDCILCKSVISFPNKDKKKYFKHMKKDHGAFYNINLMLIFNLLDRNHILKLIANIKNGENSNATEKKKKVCDAEVQTDHYYQATSDYPITEDDIVLIDSGLPVPKPIMLSNPTNALNQIEEIQRFLGQFTGASDQFVNHTEEMDISSDFATVVVENTSNQNSFEMDVPSDVELEEAISMSTPKTNKVKKVKREFIEPNPNSDPIEVMLDDEDDFNILDMTNDDFVLTAGGPQPISDYTSFIPGAVIPLSYDPFQPVSQPFSIESASNQSFVQVETSPNTSYSNTKDVDNSQHDENSTFVGNLENQKEKKFSRDKDMLTVYLQNSSEYFKKFPKQITTASKERAQRFTDVDPQLPAGWKIKTFDRKTGKSTGRQDKEFLSPELKVFRSRIAVVEYMKAMGGYSEEEMYNVLPIKVKREKV